LPNLTKHIYGCSPFEQSYKIGGKKTANFDPYKGLLMKKAPNLPDFDIYIYNLTNKLQHVAKLYEDAYFLKNSMSML
jgi:hypothetical protein